MHGLRSPGCALLLWVLSCCAGSQIEAWAGSPLSTVQSPSAVEMQPGQTYVAGTRLRIPKGSASFVIPAGWHAQLPEDSEAIIAVSESGGGFCHGADDS